MPCWLYIFYVVFRNSGYSSIFFLINKFINNNLHGNDFKVNKENIIISRRIFNHLLIEAFRYALPRDKTRASEEMAEFIIEYWDKIYIGFQNQIKRDIKSAIEYKDFEEIRTLNAWKKVLELKEND